MTPDHFTEKDASDFAAFINFVYEKMEMHVKPKDAFDFAKLYQTACALKGKIDSHIFEVKRVVENTPKEEAKKDKK